MIGVKNLLYIPSPAVYLCLCPTSNCGNSKCMIPYMMRASRKKAWAVGMVTNLWLVFRGGEGAWYEASVWKQSYLPNNNKMELLSALNTAKQIYTLLWMSVRTHIVLSLVRFATTVIENNTPLLLLRLWYSCVAGAWLKNALTCMLVDKHAICPVVSFCRFLILFWLYQCLNKTC